MYFIYLEVVILNGIYFCAKFFGENVSVFTFKLFCLMELDEIRVRVRQYLFKN